MNSEGISDNNGYLRGNIEHSDLISRQIAYKEIYLKFRSKFPLSFSAYIVHHIDGNKHNNSVNNLYLCTRDEHEFIHQEQKLTLTKFQTSLEIDRFLGKEKQNELDEYKKLREVEFVDNIRILNKIEFGGVRFKELIIKLCAHLKDCEYIRVRDLVKMMGYSRQRAFYVLEELTEMGLLVNFGNLKNFNVYYFSVDKKSGKFKIMDYFIKVRGGL